MKKDIISILCIVFLLSFVMAPVSFAASKPVKDTAVKNFSQKVAEYPANVVKKATANVAKTGKQSVDVVAKTGKDTAEVVGNEVKTLGEIPKEPGKIKDATIEPVKGTSLMVGETAKGTAETTVEATKDTVTLPVEAAKE
jgi:hypothetical protein